MPPTIRRIASLAKGSALVGITAIVAAGAIVGCAEEKPVVVVEEAPPPPPPPPPAPKITSIEQLMKELGISSKIRLPEDKAPSTEHERVAVLKFFDAFAKSNFAALKGSMSEEDQLILALMEETGAFAKSTGEVERIDLQTGSVGGEPYVMAIYRTGELFQPQLWQFKVEGEGRNVQSQVFESYVQPVEVLTKIRGDMIPEWVKLVAAERRMADDPDEIIKPPQRVQKSEESESTTVAGDGPITAPPMRQKPPAEPIKPPDFKPGGN